MAEPLIPEDIENVTFPTSMRGYDRDSVDIFLQEVATAYEAAYTEVQAIRTGAQKPYRSLGEEMGDLLQHAKDSAESTKRAAEEEAKRLREQAAEDSEATVKAAESQAAEIRMAAEREASQKIEDAAETVAQLEAMDKESREELRSLRVRLDHLSDQLRALEPVAKDESAPKVPEAVPPPPYVPHLETDTMEVSLEDSNGNSGDPNSKSLADEPKF
jgi:cell division initiation protein